MLSTIILKNVLPVPNDFTVINIKRAMIIQSFELKITFYYI